MQSDVPVAARSFGGSNSRITIGDVRLKSLVAIVLLTLGSLSQASPFEEFYHSLPLLLCQDESYRACQGAESVEVCTLNAKAYREPCADGVSIDTPEALPEPMECIILAHNGASSMEEFEARCGGLNINLSKAREKLGNMEPETVKQLLQ